MFYGVEPGTAIPLGIVLLLILVFGFKNAIGGGKGKGSGRGGSSGGSSGGGSSSGSDGTV